ncbi:hypothetical protein ACNKHV_09305 [Shigella flexneri]
MCSSLARVSPPKMLTIASALSWSAMTRVSAFSFASVPSSSTSVCPLRHPHHNAAFMRTIESVHRLAQLSST